MKIKLRLNQVRARLSSFPKRFEHFLRLRDAARDDSTTSIAAIHFWDTREKFRETWPLNVELRRYEFETLHRNLPEDFEVQHHIFVHDVTNIQAVNDLLDELVDEFDVVPHWVEADLTDIEYFHKFNFVLNNAFETLEPDLFSKDYVFMSTQDAFILNHFEKNFLQILIELITDPSEEFRDTLGYYRNSSYDYVSHTIGAEPEWNKFDHNATAGPGVFPIEKYPFVKHAAEQSGNNMTAEAYLGRRLMQECLYLQPNDNLYFGDYFMEELTESRVEKILTHARDPEKTPAMKDAIGEQWAGSLHKFLGYE